LSLGTKEKPRRGATGLPYRDGGYRGGKHQTKESVRTPEGIPPSGISLRAAMIAAFLLFHNPNWREVICLSPSEIEQWAKAIRDRK
jgi:hypothetical protein